jgi:signal transduction histidine kinase
MENSRTAAKQPMAEHDFSPIEAAHLVRLRVFLTMRWFVICGIIVSALIATFVFGIVFPLVPVFLITGFMVVYNTVMLYQLRRLNGLPAETALRRMNTYSIIHITLDVLVFTLMLHYTGGIENPFLFIIVLHIAGASTLLNRKSVFWIVTLTLAMVVLLVTLEFTGLISHFNLANFITGTVYQDAGYVLAVLAAFASILYATAFIATAISNELNKRQQEVVNLRELLLDETTEELERVSREIDKLAEEKNKFLRFLGIAAHDMKAPLAAIQSYFGIMLNGYTGELTSKQKGMLERSSIRIYELLQLISDLLDIPRIETGQLVQEMKVFSLRSLAQRCLSEQRALAKEKGLELKTRIPAKLPRIYGSPSRLQQVLTNLINNAINYTVEGTIKVCIEEDAENIRVEVSDTGIGVPAEDIDKIFEDFFRASNVDVKGTGLGLSITRRIVESHGGNISVESPCHETNCGSKFTFTLSKSLPGG